MINPRTRIYVLLLGLAVLVFVINMVRTRRLQERYALVWLLAGAGFTIAPLTIPWLDRLAYALGFDYPPALLLLGAVIGLMLIIFQLSLSVSHNAETIKVLTQEIGLLRQEMGELRSQESGAARCGELPGDRSQESEVRGQETGTSKAYPEPVEGGA